MPKPGKLHFAADGQVTRNGEPVAKLTDPDGKGVRVSVWHRAFGSWATRPWVYGSFAEARDDVIAHFSHVGT